MNAQDVQKIHARQRKITKDTYMYILKDIICRIRKYAEGGSSSLVYSVPLFITGYPLYDKTKASMYLQRQLINLGYSVSLTEDYSLSVKWQRKI